MVDLTFSFLLFFFNFIDKNNMYTKKDLKANNF
jgi:hypothetical protein